MKPSIKAWAGLTSTSAWGLGLSILSLTTALIICWLGIIAPLHAQTTERLKYLGRYEAVNLLDEFQDVGIVGDNDQFLAIASVTGLAIVEREAINSGTVDSSLGSYRIDRDNEPSNLDGAPLVRKWAPKFYEVIGSGPYLYVATRFDGLWIFRLESSGAISEVGRLLRPREFTESVKILNDKMFLTHHVDGIEVLDLTDPSHPETIATLTEGFVDAWGISPEADGSIWVADGMGGLKLARLDGNQLIHVTGETLETSPGVVQDVAVAGNWVVGAIAGQGVAVYEKATAARVGTFPLKGVCLDLESIDDQRVAVSCTSWLHVIELDATGQPSIVASTRLHRREPHDPSYTPSHQSYRVAWGDQKLYVGGWHNADAYQLVTDDPDDDPDIQVSGQRAHFSAGPAASTEVISFQITNAGEGVLDISEVICPAAIVCNLNSALVQPDNTIELTLSYDGTSPDLHTQVDILSNDPDDGLVRITVFTPGAERVDPQEPAPDFTGSLVIYDYGTQTFSETGISLSDSTNAGQAVHLGFFGGFCPACAWKGASIAADITARLPQGAVNFLIEVPRSQAPTQHIMEKIHMPVGFLFSTSANVLYEQPDNVGSLGLPAFRDYVIDPTGTVTTVLANDYSPEKILDALEGAVGELQEVDLSVSISDDPDPVQVGQPLTYTIQVQNNGPDSATNVILTDTLSSSVTFVSVTPSQGNCTQATGVVTCNLGTIVNEGLATAAVLVTPTVTGSINNTVVIATTETDPNPGNNTATENTTIEASSPDSDGDGLSDEDEINIHGTDPTLRDSDGDGFGDGVEVGESTQPNDPAGPWPAADGDLAPHTVYDGVVNIADVLVVTRMALGLVTPDALAIAHGDLAKSGTSAGVIDTADLILIMQKAINAP